MRRSLASPLAVIAGLALLLSACSGESPTSPTTPGGGGSNPGGTCNVTLSLAATSVTPLAGTAVIVRAAATKNGAPVPDGTTVAFTVDFGFFYETGLPSIQKVTQNGYADVTLASRASGLAKLKATLECATAPLNVEFQPVPTEGPYISSVSPPSGSCAGGDTVTIKGGRFTVAGFPNLAYNVLFGNRPAQVVSTSDTEIVVTTPTRTLANPQIPEAVDVVVQLSAGPTIASATLAKGFTYFCVDPSRRTSIASVSPNAGSPDGGETVTIAGSNFLPTIAGIGTPGSSVATTRVTFGGAPASITSMTNESITVRTPRHVLANPAVPETVDVEVLVDLGMASQQSAVAPNAYTYRGSGQGSCPATSPTFYVSSGPTPNGGSPDGGDVVTIVGGGFFAGNTTLPTSAISVLFGGLPGVVTAASDTQLTVSTPRRTLSNPDAAETVDVVVRVDLGGPKESCVTVANAFTYFPGGANTPVITSLSPTSGPNDASTRVTIFGRNFRLPSQVFVGGVEATVVSIQPNQIIFLTPTATGPNSGLAGKANDVMVRDTYSGKESNTLPFTYYSCPTIGSASPAVVPWYEPTLVTITGNAFEEPVEAIMTFGTGTTGTQVRLDVVSVSSTQILVRVPAIDPLQYTGSGGTGCANISATISLRFLSLSCGGPFEVPISYRLDPMTISSASPNTLPQNGGSGTVITVTGTNFYDPMTVEVFNTLYSVAIQNAVVTNTGTLTFPAPPIPDSAFNTQTCVPSGGTGFTGVQSVPTSFGIRLKNARTGCTVALPNVLIYTPQDTTCRTATPPTITTASLASATICLPYSQTLAGAAGNPPYTWSATGLPTGLVLDPSTGVISGQPKLSATGTGGSTTPSVTVTITDSLLLTGTKTFPLAVTDPNGPFTVTGGTTLSATAAPSGVSQTAGSFSVPGAYPVTWSVDPASLTAALVGWTVVPTSPGSATTTITLTPPIGANAGTGTFTLVAVDAPPCNVGGDAVHRSTATVTVTVN